MSAEAVARVAASGPERIGSENRTMDTTYPQDVGRRPQQAARARLCPRCGEAMIEADRVVEGGYLYIWYECGESGCDERWLARMPVCDL